MVEHAEFESQKIKDSILKSYNNLQSEKEKNAKILFVFIVSFIGLIGGLIFLALLLKTNYNSTVLIVGFLVGVVYYLSVFIKWTNKISRENKVF